MRKIYLIGAVMRSAFTPVAQFFFRITETGDQRVTEDNNNRITE